MATVAAMGVQEHRRADHVAYIAAVGRALKDRDIRVADVTATTSGDGRREATLLSRHMRPPGHDDYRCRLFVAIGGGHGLSSPCPPPPQGAACVCLLPRPPRAGAERWQTPPRPELGAGPRPAGPPPPP